MHRLFIAIRPPAAIRAGLLPLMNGIKGARWQDDAQLHLTLRFVGETDRHRANGLAEALVKIRFRPFEIALGGMGCFERKGYPHTLWAGVHPRDALAQLHRKIDRACIEAGIPPDERSYFPHITLARLNRSTGSIDGFLAEHAGLASPPFTVTGFALFESHLGQGGSIYEMVARYPAL